MGPDEELVRRTRQGDREAFGSLVDRHRRAVLAFAMQKGLQPAEAEDVAQEVFLKAFHGLNTLKNPAHFPRWVYGITAHVAVDYLRSRRRRHEESSQGEEPSWNEMAGRDDRDELRGVFKALHELPEDHRIVVTLRYLQGLTPKEIAERLGEPRGTVRSRLHHALTYLQLALGTGKSGATSRTPPARLPRNEISARMPSVKPEAGGPESLPPDGGATR